MALAQQSRLSLREWVKSGEPFIWFNAAAVTISTIAVVGLLLLLATRGLGHFWPGTVYQFKYSQQGVEPQHLLAELVESESVAIEQLQASGMQIDIKTPFVRRDLLKLGNRDLLGHDFSWVLHPWLSDTQQPVDAMVLERREWGNFYGYLRQIKQNGAVIADSKTDDGTVWQTLQKQLESASKLHDAIATIEKKEIGTINYKLDQLRLDARKLELNKASLTDTQIAVKQERFESERMGLQEKYKGLQSNLENLYQQAGRDSLVAETADGRSVEIPLAKIVHAYRPNAMNVFQKIHFYFAKLWEFLTAEPREANTEGGIFPAIFGTVAMVMIMSIIVTPFGVIAAVYLREYAKQGLVTRIVRIAVNNLAGVPSIVYGMFGLGFFVYFLGANIDHAFFAAALPAPTFGTPGLLWASLTLALLTLPVVIVATEEGLSRIPRSLREGSLALGATKAETLWRVVLPMASPAMMTGLILAVARAAGEVAPLMLVGVVKLAPALPVDGNFPFVHLDRKFMHLGFHIYDVGFQSPNVEAARPLVYATALLLVIIIALLNFSAVALRNHLREKYRALEM
ncbi:MAG: phosphate transporter, inner rane subunit PstA [Verrucomicrobiaceae bacterium]|nr:phosphate transporter, inner rane subunit PstA [Verrucomicrobiaceae bacterium]